MSLTSDIIRGHTETIILAQLLEHDSYGYEINKAIRDRTGGQYEAKRAPSTPPSAVWSRPDISAPIGATKAPAPAAGIMPSPTKDELFTTKTRPSGSASSTSSTV